ncbi:Transcription initiation factor TFIID subunit 6, partial [Fragariocoptes setiger]
RRPTMSAKFSIDSIKLMAETANIGNLDEDGAKFLAEDVSNRLRSIVKEAEKFVCHSRRKRLLTKDIDYALKIKNMPPILGFQSEEFIPFRFASGGGREIFFHEDKEIILADVIASGLQAKLPQDVAIRSHWLVIDGIQPAIPENPPPLSRDQQRLECVDPLKSIEKADTKLQKNRKADIHGRAPNPSKKHIEIVRVKQLATHELSVEQQLYYKEITEACVGSVEPRRHQALQSLSYDPGLHQMLPRLITFISEGVKVNVVHNNLALLIYLMRMVKALLENQTLYLEKYLHELCPTVITCIVSKQICNRPDQDNHYALRDFASRLLNTICKNFNTSTNCLQTRITRLLTKALDTPNLPMASFYGSISALCELGPEVHRGLIFPRLKMIGERIRGPLERPSGPEGSAEVHVKTLILRPQGIPSTIRDNRPPPDDINEYISDYGFLGPDLHAIVTQNDTSTSAQAQVQQISYVIGSFNHNLGTLVDTRAIDELEVGSALQTHIGPISVTPITGSIALIAKGKLLAEGKTKQIYEHASDSSLVYIESKDRITAGDGAKAHNMKDKAIYSTRTNGAIFEFLNSIGVPTSFVRRESGIAFVAKKCTMIPIEWVTRRVATGSFLRRHSNVKEGFRFVPVKLETFFKDDANHDPYWSIESIREAQFEGLRPMSNSDIDRMQMISRLVFEVLERAWQTVNHSLIDMKVEFGVAEGSNSIVLSDVIDNDSWRLWPNGDKRLMLDKQVYRNLDSSQMDAQAMDKIRSNFALVAERTEQLFLSLVPKPTTAAYFMAPRVGILMGSSSDRAFGDKIVDALKRKFNISQVSVHISSAHKSTGYTLQVLEQLNQWPACQCVIAVAGRSNGLGLVASANSPIPVINCPPISDMSTVSVDLWSSMRLPSGLGCTTILGAENAALATAQILANNDAYVWSRIKTQQTLAALDLISVDESLQKE